MKRPPPDSILFDIDFCFHQCVGAHKQAGGNQKLDDKARDADDHPLLRPLGRHAGGEGKNDFARSVNHNGQWDVGGRHIQKNLHHNIDQEKDRQRRKNPKPLKRANIRHGYGKKHGGYEHRDLDKHAHRRDGKRLPDRLHGGQAYRGHHHIHHAADLFANGGLHIGKHDKKRCDHENIAEQHPNKGDDRFGGEQRAAFDRQRIAEIAFRPVKRPIKIGNHRHQGNHHADQPDDNQGDRADHADPRYLHCIGEQHCGKRNRGGDINIHHGMGARLKLIFN